MAFYKKKLPKYLALTIISCSLIASGSVFADLIPNKPVVKKPVVKKPVVKKPVVKKPVVKKPKVKAITSPAHRFALQRPTLFARLLAKDKAALKAGKVQTFIKYRKNERGKSMIVTYVRAIIPKPRRAVYRQLANMNRSKEFMPRVFYSKVLKKLGRNRYHVYRKIKVAYTTIKMNFTIRLYPYRRFQFNLMRNLKNDIVDSVGAFNFEDIEGGKHTFVSYFMYSDSGRWIPGFIRKPLLRKDLPGVLKALRKRVVSGGTWKKK